MSKKQSFVVQGKINNNYKIANKTDLSVMFLNIVELEDFLKSRFNIVELESYMNNISSDDEIYSLFE